MIKTLIEINKRFLPYLLVFPVLVLILDLVPLFQGQSYQEVFSLFSILVIIECFFIPWFTLNVVYLATTAFVKNHVSLWKVILLKVALSIIGALLATGIMESVYLLNGLKDDDVISLGTLQFTPVTTNLITNGFLAFIIAIPVFLSQARNYEWRLNAQKKALEVRRLENLQTQSRLDALQSKINPHFLHNALSTLATLIYEDPKKAEKIVLGLSDMFRYSFRDNEVYMVPLKTELELVKTYLEIEKIRFEDGLTYEFEIDQGIMEEPIPKFLLQPLVENAVKHGASKVKRGFVQLAIHKKANEFDIRISDNGPDFSQNPDFGFGLNSTVEKLNLLYPNKYAFNLRNKPEKAISINLKTENNA